MTEEELAKKINRIIIIIGIIVVIIILPIAGRSGEKSVKDLNNFGVYSLYASENEKDGALTNRVEYYVCNGNFDLNTLTELSKKGEHFYR